ncbi:hypothetical protein M409DRAFT_69147 [Zasmidium cellare ATCC 36951]|uniref:Major facilitator superfamily (MFS) profile domain-containing protein n=1 Tax=Zasmidium cellare ATCC 36951 TaxID=1080233 RepID=A0A6A6C8M8_ZASCE|nr:uncharacterized protein M409DRAFT_69147 [Zasmidium cellare ATCC 36951]KAF2162590.1 hypothetical protein M409DRAFT_69147 [Zasmidium cellare ATCC 36951]
MSGQAAEDEISSPTTNAVEEKPVSPLVEPQCPDGGLQAWLQVLGSWMMIFNTWGILNTFGDYQTYYESGRIFHASSSDISWIRSIQSFMVFATGALIGPIYDRGHLRLLLIMGVFGVVFGHMMLSLCHTFWEALLAQGFVVGIGGGCLFVPSLAILSPYFNTRLGLAIGLAASGSSIGGIIYPVMFAKLIDQVGFGWTTRIIGFAALATLLVPICVSRMLTKPGRVRKLLDMTAFTDGPFMLCVFGCFFGFAGIYVAFFYVPFFASSSGFWSASKSLYLVCILNTGSFFGRTLPNWLLLWSGLQNLGLATNVTCSS